MVIWIAIGLLVAGLAAHPGKNTNKPKMAAVFKPHYGTGGMDTPDNGPVMMVGTR